MQEEPVATDKPPLSPKQVIKYHIKAHYPQEAKKLKNSDNKNSLRIDYKNFIATLEGEGYKFFDIKPKETIRTANQAVNECCRKEYATVILEDVPYNEYLRLIDSKHIGKFVSTNAMVKSVSPIQARPLKTVFECMGCRRQHTIIQETNIQAEPVLCTDCGGKSFQYMAEETVFINKQHLKLEEPLELRKDGTTREFNALIEGDVVDPNNKITPGEVVHIAGIVNNIYNEKNKEFYFLIELNNITKLDKTFQDIKVTDEDKDTIQELVDKPNLMELLKNTVAPTIHGHDEIKEGLVIQLFSGSSGNTATGIHGRTVIHLLMIGDPGIAKSVILKSVSRLSPKGIYINGAAASRAGLMGAAVKDELTGRWTIEAGAIPLADQGIVCIDELDKMPNQKDILALNEPMEQQTVTETKAGLNVTMNARTPILAAANPKFGRFRRNKGIMEQITIPDTTFSRFDLTYAVEDLTNYDEDVKLADHLLTEDLENDKEVVEQELMTKYIAYAKQEFKPKLTTEAKQILSEFYASTRKKAAEDDESKPITPRDLGALKRIALTIARIHLRDYVTAEDATEAIRIYSDSLKTLGLTPETAGELIGDMSKKELKKLAQAEAIVNGYYLDYGDFIPKDAVNDIISEIKVSCGYDETKAKQVYQDTMINIQNQQE